MKKLLALALSLVYTLSLISCDQSPADTVPPATEPALEDSLPVSDAEIIPQSGGQSAAIHAYNQILDSLGGLPPHDPGYPGYPEEFGDAYYQDGFLVVCLTDVSEEMQKKYCSLVDDPQILQFKAVTHSYNNLYALQMAIVQTEGIIFTSVGIDVTENHIDIGIPDITKESEALALILKNLPQDIKDCFSEYPLEFTEEKFATLD